MPFAQGILNVWLFSTTEMVSLAMGSWLIDLLYNNSEKAIKMDLFIKQKYANKNPKTKI